MILTKEKLIATLVDILAHVTADDSFEGNIAYVATDERYQFDVHSAYRTGNRDGQGNTRLVTDGAIRWTGDETWRAEILLMIRERLVAFLGEEHMKAVPPMLYDDAIRDIADRAAFGTLPEEMYPAGSLLHRARAAEAEVLALTAQVDLLKAGNA